MGEYHIYSPQDHVYEVMQHLGLQRTKFVRSSLIESGGLAIEENLYGLG